MLDRITIKPGFRAVDVGCGPIGIMNLLSERVGPDGAVVGVEREPRFVDMARTQLSERWLTKCQRGQCGRTKDRAREKFLRHSSRTARID